jgi:hypothetical protein
MNWELYFAAGIAALVAAAGAVGLRLFRDEYSLRRKKVLSAKY